MWTTGVLRVLTGLLLRLFIRTEVHLADSLPPEPFILCANHNSIIDPPLLFCMVRRRKLLWAATYLFRIPVVGRLLRWSGAHPVQGVRQSMRTMRLSLRMLETGGLVIIFPQGGVRDVDERMQVRRGAALLAGRSGAPVVPVVLSGTEQVLPVGQYLPRRGRVQVYFGTPLWCGETDVHEMTGRIRDALEELAQKARREDVR